jgi:glycosyltransferase involved in cell wall biosynthesis
MVYGKEARALLPTLDIVHAHHPFQSARLVKPYCKRYGLPLVFTNHSRYDLLSDAYGSLFPQDPRYAVLASMLRDVVNDCDLVMTPATEIARWLADYTGYPLAVTVAHGIDTESFAHPQPSDISRMDLGLADDDFVFCYAGRLSPEKNIGYLLSEFIHVATNIPRMKLLIVGGGKELDEAREYAMESTAADQIIFTGELPYCELPAVLHVADAFVTASVSETFGMNALEAMAAGLPVVAIASPGVSEVVADGMTGLLGRSDGPGELSRNLLRMASDAGLRERLGKGALERAQEFSLDNTAGVVLRHYERLIAERLPRVPS